MEGRGGEGGGRERETSRRKEGGLQDFATPQNYFSDPHFENLFTKGLKSSGVRGEKVGNINYWQSWNGTNKLNTPGKTTKLSITSHQVVWSESNHHYFGRCSHYTKATNSLRQNISNWNVLNGHTLKNHQLITSKHFKLKRFIWAYSSSLTTDAWER